MFLRTKLPPEVLRNISNIFDIVLTVPRGEFPVKSHGARKREGKIEVTVSCGNWLSSLHACAGGFRPRGGEKPNLNILKHF